MAQETQSMCANFKISTRTSREICLVTFSMLYSGFTVTIYIHPWYPNDSTKAAAYRGLGVADSSRNGRHTSER